MYEKLLSGFKRACNENNQLGKKRNDTLNKKEEKMHNKQKDCYICKKRFSTDDNNKKYHKVRDQYHYTGKYRGAAHNT